MKKTESISDLLGSSSEGINTITIKNTNWEDIDINKLMIELNSTLDLFWDESMEELVCGDDNIVCGGDNALNSTGTGADISNWVQLRFNFSEPVDSVTIGGLKVRHQPSGDTRSKANKLILVVEVDEEFTYDGTTISKPFRYVFKDTVETYIAACEVNSEKPNRILFNDANDDVPYQIKPIIIQNDPFLYENGGKTILSSGDSLKLSILNTNNKVWWSSEQSPVIAADGPDCIEYNEIDENGELEFFIKENCEIDTIRYTISDLTVNYSDSDSAFVLLKQNTDIIGIDKEKLIIGKPTISMVETKYWINQDTMKILPELIVVDDNYNLLRDGFELYLWDTNSDTQDELFSFYSEQTNSSISNVNRKSIEFINNDGSNSWEIDSVYITIDTSIYNSSYSIDDLPDTHIIRLTSLGDDPVKNFIKTEKNILVQPSFFFTQPVIYRNANNENKVGFNVKESFFDEVDSVIVYKLPLIVDIQAAYDNQDNKSSLFELLIDEQGYKKDSQTIDIWNNGQCCSDLINVSATISDSVLQTINLKLDLFSKAEEIRVMVGADEEGLNRSSNQEDQSQVFFYPHGSPLQYSFADDVRQVNPELFDIILFSEDELNSDNLAVKISSLDGQQNTLSGNYIFQCDNDPTCLHLNFSEYMSQYGDGIYNISIEEINNCTESCSTYFSVSRYFYFDTQKPIIENISIFEGKKPDGSGMDITSADNIEVRFSEGPIMFTDTNMVFNGNIIDMDMDHIFTDSLIVKMNLLNNGFIADTMTTSYIDPKSIPQIIENMEYDLENGMIQYCFTIEDRAGNVSYDTLTYSHLNEGEKNEWLNNYPNPFNPLAGEKTTFRYTLTEQMDWGKLIIFDNNGDLVHIEEIETLSPGTKEFQWDGRTINNKILHSGVYFSMLRFPEYYTRRNKTAIINE